MGLPQKYDVLLAVINVDRPDFQMRKSAEKDARTTVLALLQAGDRRRCADPMGGPADRSGERSKGRRGAAKREDGGESAARVGRRSTCPAYIGKAAPCAGKTGMAIGGR